MEATIESGKWQRVVFPDTDAKYQEWKSARQQKIDNAVPRTSQQNKPRKIDPNNNVDAMYARLRAQKEQAVKKAYSNSLLVSGLISSCSHTFKVINKYETYSYHHTLPFLVLLSSD